MTSGRYWYINITITIHTHLPMSEEPKAHPGRPLMATTQRPPMSHSTCLCQCRFEPCPNSPILWAPRIHIIPTRKWGNLPACLLQGGVPSTCKRQCPNFQGLITLAERTHFNLVHILTFFIDQSSRKGWAFHCRWVVGSSCFLLGLLLLIIPSQFQAIHSKLFSQVIFYCYYPEWGLYLPSSCCLDSFW